MSTQMKNMTGVPHDPSLTLIPDANVDENRRSKEISCKWSYKDKDEISKTSIQSLADPKGMEGTPPGLISLIFIVFGKSLAK